MTTPARKTHYQAMHEISGQGGFGQTSGQLGVLPAGSVLSIWHFVTSQAFNSTTNTLSVGFTPGGIEIGSAVNCQAVGRADGAPLAPASGPFATDQPIFYTLASTGPAPTQGVITVWLEYLPGAG